MYDLLKVIWSRANVKTGYFNELSNRREKKRKVHRANHWPALVVWKNPNSVEITVDHDHQATKKGVIQVSVHDKQDTINGTKTRIEYQIS